MNQKVIFGIVLLIAIGGSVLFFTDRNKNQIVCTMEAKLCSDGSSVGRVGPHCEFAPCPEKGAGGGGILPYTSGIREVVLRGPMCPVVRVGEECPDAPYGTKVLISRMSTSSEIFATVQSGNDGKFLINLPPGDYVANATNEGISKICSPVSVSIGSDEIKNINISCDTGIR